MLIRKKTNRNKAEKIEPSLVWTRVKLVEPRETICIFSLRKTI